MSERCVVCDKPSTRRIPVQRSIGAYSPAEFKPVCASAMCVRVLQERVRAAVSEPLNIPCIELESSAMEDADGR